MNNEIYNSEGYKDPTASTAIRNISRKLKSCITCSRNTKCDFVKQHNYLFYHHKEETEQ